MHFQHTLITSKVKMEPQSVLRQIISGKINKTHNPRLHPEKLTFPFYPFASK
jgi:hypothetical protein